MKIAEYLALFVNMLISMIWQAQLQKDVLNQISKINQIRKLVAQRQLLIGTLAMLQYFIMVTTNQ